MTSEKYIILKKVGSGWKQVVGAKSYSSYSQAEEVMIDEAEYVSRRGDEYAVAQIVITYKV